MAHSQTKPWYSPIWLWLEMGIVFFGVPWAMTLIHFPKIPVLIGATAICAWALRASPNFSFRKVIRRPFPRAAFTLLALRTMGACLLIGTLCMAFFPERWLDFPRHRPGLYVLVMLLYPVLSAFPQELIYRSFFFQRYASILPHAWAMIAVNSAAFAFLHILYHNAVAVGLSLLAGGLLSNTYAKSRSLVLVSLEHALYGCAALTLGLGEFFYRTSPTWIP